MRARGEHRLHVVLEAHVEHLVGLVEHDVLHLRQVEVAVLQVVDDPAGRAHDDVEPVAQRALLRPIGRAAVEDRDAQPVGPREHLKGLRHLPRELARGREHEDGGLPPALLGSRAAVLHPLHHRQRKRERLARAGLRASQHVGAAAQQGVALDLDRRELDDALGGEQLHHPRVNLAVGDDVVHLCLLLHAPEEGVEVDFDGGSGVGGRSGGASGGRGQAGDELRLLAAHWQLLGLEQLLELRDRQLLDVATGGANLVLHLSEERLLRLA